MKPFPNLTVMDHPRIRHTHHMPRDQAVSRDLTRGPYRLPIRFDADSS